MGLLKKNNKNDDNRKKISGKLNKQHARSIVELQLFAQ